MDDVTALREILAENQHEIWAHWMKYLFSVSDTNPDGTVEIPADKVARWMQQMKTPYIALSEQEKESDRHQADKVIAVLRTAYEKEGYYAFDDILEGVVRVPGLEDFEGEDRLYNNQTGRI